MGEYLKYICQLVLSPSRGWEDISHDGTDPEELLRRGYYPMLGVASVAQFLQLFYNRALSLTVILERALATFVAYFVALFLSRMVLDAMLPKVTDGALSDRRTATLNILCLGVMLMIQLLTNCLPPDLTFLKFLPVYVLLIFYKASRYMAVREDSEMTYMLVGILSVVAVPVAVKWLLDLVLG